MGLTPIFLGSATPPTLAWANMKPEEIEAARLVVHRTLPVAAPMVTATAVSILLRNAPQVLARTGIIGGAMILVLGAGVGVEWLADQLHNPQRQLEPLTPQEFEYLLQREHHYHPEMPLTSLQSWFLNSYPIVKHQVQIPAGSFFAASGPVGPLQPTKFGTFTQEELDYFKRLPRDAKLRLAPLFEGLHKSQIPDDLRRVLVPLILKMREYQEAREFQQSIFHRGEEAPPLHSSFHANLPMWEKTGMALVLRQYPGLQHFFETLSKSDIPLPEQRMVVCVLIQQMANTFLSARPKQDQIWLLPLVRGVDPTQLNPYFTRGGNLLVFQNAKDLAAYLKDLFGDPQTLQTPHNPAEKVRHWPNGIVVRTQSQNNFLPPETDEDKLRHSLLVQQGVLPVYPPYVYMVIPGHTPPKEMGGDEYYIVYIFDQNHHLIQVRISSKQWEEVTQVGFGSSLQFSHMSKNRRDIQIYPPPR